MTPSTPGSPLVEQPRDITPDTSGPDASELDTPAPDAPGLDGFGSGTVAVAEQRAAALEALAARADAHAVAARSARTRVKGQ